LTQRAYDAFVTMQLLNRELSWLDFNARVLAMAEAEHVPLLERVKFCAIFATNLDEFFMVRVAGMQRQAAAGVTAPSADGTPAGETLAAVLERSAGLARDHASVWRNAIEPALAAADIRIARWRDLSDTERAGLAGLFVERVFPVLTPLAVDPAHPFPYISNRSLNLAVTLRDPIAGTPHVARVKLPPILSRFVAVHPDAAAGTTLLPLEELIAGSLERLFPGMEITGHHAFRLTRDGDLAIDDDADDLLRTIEDELRGRRLAPAVRLEVAETTPGAIVDLLVREIGVGAEAVHRLPEPLGLGDVWEIHALDRPELKDAPFTPRANPALAPDAEGEVDVIHRLGRGEVLVHHPYESFAGSVQAFIEQAADDPQVLAIKQTLYRTTADPIVNALVRAAEAGKQVVVLVELKARFDETNNVGWARMLERAGCHVVYGMIGLKTHAKLVLVVRREGDATRRYVHIGTGNYNATTTRTYEDFGFLSSDAEMAREVGELFNLLTGHAHRIGAERLMVAPFDLRPRLLARIAEQADVARAGGAATIAIKCNALTDPELIDALYQASQAGVRIDLVVRGICSLRPGVPGLSETIRVRSILGRFLEHSRIFRFGSGAAAERWIGSADIMERNLDRRVEVLVRLDDPVHVARVDRVLDLALADTASAWTLNPDGDWTPAPDPIDGRSLQSELLADLDSPSADRDGTSIQAAGGVVWRRGGRRGDRLELAVIHRPRDDDWSFPKGKLEPGEEPLVGAVREVVEETGLRVLPGEPLAESRYLKATADGPRPKVVRWWAMEAIGGSFSPSTEVDAMRWLTPDEAGRVLSRRADRELLVRFMSAVGRAPSTRR